MKEGHLSVIGLFGIKESKIALIELFLLHLFACKRFYHPDPSEGVLQG